MTSRVKPKIVEPKIYSPVEVENRVLIARGVDQGQKEGAFGQWIQHYSYQEEWGLVFVVLDGYCL